MKTSHFKLLAVLAAILLPLVALAQVNSGSDGHDGALNPTGNLVIDMADHPDGIYHYTSVNIPAGITVSFIPNAGNKPVVWLVQGGCTVLGTISVSASDANISIGGRGGPGGFPGGNAGGGGALAGDGMGPGGGHGGGVNNLLAGNGSFAVKGTELTGYYGACIEQPNQATAGDTYGSQFLVPLAGGSGGGGARSDYGGGGGGGAILIAATQSVQIDGQILATGGSSPLVGSRRYGGGGTGGAVRIVSENILGSGTINVSPGLARHNCGVSYDFPSNASPGFIRLDALANSFVGNASGVVTRGFQPIIIPPANQAVSLAIQNVGGVAVAANPNGQLTTPDVIVPANQQNPIPIVVRCTNIPLNTEIIVDVKPANGVTVRAVALNTAGTQATSTATVQVNMPRGGGTIQAKAVSGIALAAASGVNDKVRSLAETGWTADGERFAQVEVTATLGGKSQIAYLTESGKRYEAN